MRSNRFSESALRAAQGNLFDLLRKQSADSAVLITGGTGLVGQAFVQVLAAYGQSNGTKIYLSVRNLDRAKKLFSAIPDHILVFFEFSKLSELVDSGVVFSHIVHLASPATPHDFNNHIFDVLETNVLQTKDLLDISLQMNAHFVLASTLEIYGNIADAGSNEDYVLEESVQGTIDNTNPRAIYPESKRLAENLCSIHSQLNNGKSSVARISHTFGPGFSDTDDRVQNQFIRKATSADPIILQSDGSLRRTYTYSLDVATALVTIMFRSNVQDFEAYNISAMQNMISIKELAEITLTAAGRKTDALVFDLPEGTAMWSGMRGGLIPSTAKIETLGWRAQYSALAGITETIKVQFAK